MRLVSGVIVGLVVSGAGVACGSDDAPDTDASADAESQIDQKALECAEGTLRTREAIDQYLEAALALDLIPVIVQNLQVTVDEEVTARSTRACSAPARRALGKALSAVSKGTAAMAACGSESCERDAEFEADQHWRTVRPRLLEFNDAVGVDAVRAAFESAEPTRMDQMYSECRDFLGFDQSGAFYIVVGGQGQRALVGRPFGTTLDDVFGAMECAVADLEGPTKRVIAAAREIDDQPDATRDVSWDGVRATLVGSAEIGTILQLSLR